MKTSNHSSRNYPSAQVTPERVTVRAPYRDGVRLERVGRLFDVIYPCAILYAILRIVQFSNLDFFLFVEAPNILKAVIGARLFCYWWVWKTLTVTFTPSTLIIKTGWLSFTLNAKESYGFSSMPHQNRKLRKPQYLPLTHHVLLEHRSQGTILLGNFYGELVAKQVVTKLQGLQAWINTLEAKSSC